jgi:transcriptional regulator with XRE-family HTH domain
VLKKRTFVNLLKVKKDTGLKTFGKNVREARRKQGFTQEELAEKCGLDFRQIGSIERGETNPTLQTIQKICKGLNTTPEKMFHNI